MIPDRVAALEWALNFTVICYEPDRGKACLRREAIVAIAAARICAMEEINSPMAYQDLCEELDACFEGVRDAWLKCPVSETTNRA